MKYRGNQLSALLSNWKTYEKMLKDYQNSSGSAAREAMKTADSLEGRLNKFTNTWDRTVNNVVNSDILKSFVSAGTGAIDLADNLGILQTALAGLAVFGTLKLGTGLVSWFKDGIDSVMKFGNALNMVKATDFVSNTANLSNAIKGLSLSQATAVLSTKALSQAQIEATLINAGFSAEEASTTASTMAMSAAETTATASTWSLSSAFSALGATIAANPIGAAITAVTAIVSIGSLAFNSYKQAQEKALATSKELTQAYKEEQSSLNDQISSYKELREQLEAGNLSTEETSSIKSQLVDIQTKLVDLYGEEASGIDLVNGKYKDQLGLLSELTKQKAQDYIATNKSAYEDAKKALNKDRNYYIGSLGTSNEITDYLSKYNDKNVNLLEGYNGIYELSVSAKVDEADRSLKQLYQNIEQLGKDTGLDVTNVLTNISKQLNNTWTDDLKAYKDTYDEYVKAQVIANDTLRPLYVQSIDAVDAYNTSLANGQGVEQAKANLDAIKNTVYENISAVEGSENVFDDLFQTISTGTQNIIPSIQEASNTISTLFTEEQSKAIDDFQTNIKTLGDALNNLSSLSTSDILDLMQQFSTFDWKKYGVTGVAGIGNISGALQDLLKQQYESTVATTGQNDALYELYANTIIASKATLSLSDALSKMNTSGKTLEDVKSEIKDLGSISSETISDLLSKYPQLEEVISQYNAGLASSEDVLNELSKVYETDFDNYKESVIEKNKYSENFYDNIVDNLPNWVKNLADAYDIDFQNFKNLSEAKEGLIKKFLMQESLADSYRLQNQSGISADDAVKNYQNSMKASKSASDLLKLIDGVNITSIDTLDLKGYTSSNKTKTKKDPKEKEEFKGSINWAEQSLKILEDSVSDAQDKLDNTKGYDAQTKAINQLIDAQELLKSGYEDTADMYETKYNKSLKGIGTYKNDIESGKVFTLQNFNGNEKLYNRVIKAQEYYNNWQDNEKSAADTGYKITDNKQSLDDREIQKQYDNVTKTIDAYKDGISEIQSLAEQFPDGSNRQFAVLSSGIKKASDEVEYLEDQLVKLQGNKSKMDADEYTEQFENISNAIQDARQSANDFLKSMADAFNASIDTSLDDLETAYKDQVDALNEQKDAYEDIVNAQKKSLELEKEKNDYEKSIAEKTDEISDIQSRISELSKAANSGDRSAQSEMKKLQEDLAKKQKDLDDTQADHKYDLEMDALDTSLDNHNDLIDTELKDNEKVYNDKIAKLETLRTKTMQLITDAGLYTDQEFGVKLSKYANEINNIINSLNTNYGSNVSGISSPALSSISNAQSQVAANSSTYLNDKSTGSVKDSVILSKLRGGTGLKGDSALNKYVFDNYGKYLTYAEMVEVAKLLSVNGISNVSDVSGVDNANNREKIRKALIGAGFNKGGYVNANGSLSSLVKSTGEDGIALVKHGEPILTVEQGKLFKELISNIKPLNNLVKLNTPNISNLTTNNSPTFKFDNMIQINGNLSGEDASTKIKSAGDDIIKKLHDAMRTK